MSTVRTFPRLHKPATVGRFVRILAVPDADGKNAQVQITMTRGKHTEVFKYWIDRIPSDFGQGFLVEKQGDGDGPNEEYHVLINGQDSSCTCPGNSFHNHCKHLAAIQKLLELGQL